MPIPWCGGEPVDHTSVDIDTDVKFETFFSTPASFDSYIVPGAAVMCTESCAIHCDVHFFSAKEPSRSVHHLTYVGDGESFHSSLYHAMTWEIHAVLFECLTIFDVCFDTIVGFVESYF